MPALTPRPAALALLPIAVVVAAGCGGGKTKTVTSTSTQTVVETVTAPPATAPPAATTPSAATPPTAPAGPRPCGRIDITYPNGEGGSSAVGIVATGLGCAEARAVTRACQRGNVTPGWSADLRSGGAVLMVAGSRRIAFRLAGGGGCG